MKYLAFLLSLLCVVSAPLYADDDAPAEEPTETRTPSEVRNDKKEAQAWFRTSLKNKQTALKILKKVKDKKSADKAGKELQKVFGVKGKATAMGESGPAQKPTGPAMEELEQKNAAKIEKLDEAINKQIERINELNLDSQDLQDGIEAMNAAM